MRKRVYLGLLGALAVICPLAIAQKAQRQAAKPTMQDVFKPAEMTGNDISSAQAQLRGRKLIAQIGLPTPTGKTTVQLTHDAGLRRVWEMYYGDEYHVLLDSSSGQLVELKNIKREWEQVHNINRSGVQSIQTEQQAKDLLLSYARKLGAPRGNFLQLFRWHKEQDSRTSDSNRGGVIYGRFTLASPGKHPYHEHQGSPGMGISLDPADGSLLFVGQEWRYDVASSLPKITAVNASSLAAGIHNAYAQAHPRAIQSATASSAVTPTLEYVLTGASHLEAGREVSAEMQTSWPKTMRLAWIVRFGADEIWIDAATGSQLGAIVSGYK